VIEDAITGDTVRKYSFAAVLGGEYAVFLEAREATVQLIVVDSEYHQSVASVYANPRSGPLDENASANFQSPEGGVYLLRVQAFPSSRSATQSSARQSTPASMRTSSSCTVKRGRKSLQ